MPKSINQHEEILYRTYVDLIAYGKYFLPGDFLKSETPDFHYIIADEVNSDSDKPLGIFIPRDHAKTTLVKASITHDFCFTKTNLERFSRINGAKLSEYWAEEAKTREPYFYAWVAKSQKDSWANVAYIRKHLEFNNVIIRYFGRLKGATWNKEDIETGHGDKLLSSSNLKSIRGQTLATIESGAQRFTRVFADDFENEQNTKTLNSREDLKNTLLAGILPAIKRGKRARLVVIGTPVHFDSFIQNMLDEWGYLKTDKERMDYPWKIITYTATQPTMKGGVLWHSYKPRSELDKKKAEYAAARKPNLYYQEYELKIQGEDTANWTNRHIKYHDGKFIHEGGNVRTEDGINYLIIGDKKLQVNTFLGCDPATDIETKESDFSVINVTAVDRANNRYVLYRERHNNIPSSGLRDEKHEIIGKMGVADYYIDLYDKFYCIGGSVEDVAMNRSILTDLNKLKIMLNKPYIIAGSVKPGGTEKLNRIYTYLNSFFTQGQIYYRKGMDNLIYETLSFGSRMAHDDDIEALYIANVNAYPPKGYIANPNYIPGKNTSLVRRRRKIKPWTVA